MILFNSTPARMYLQTLRLCPNVKSKTTLGLSTDLTCMTLLRGHALDVDPAALELLRLLNDMNGCMNMQRRQLVEQSKIWQDDRLRAVKCRYRSFKEIANLLEAFWFTQASLEGL
jgi:hypothetical protein